MKRLTAGLAAMALLAGAGVVFAQSAKITLAPAAKDAAAGNAAVRAGGGAPSPAQPPGPGAPPKPGEPMVLMMRGLDKITGRPTDIIAPIGKPVHFATLTITARYCYSTPPSETPETAAFVQIEDHRPDQPARRIFSGWMYASSPGLNALEHPLYDVWVIKCQGSNAPQAVASAGPAKVLSPDASDKDEKIEELPADAGR